MPKTITGLTPLAEQIIQERMMLAASRSIETSMQQELGRTWRALAEVAGNTGATAGVIYEHGQRVERILSQRWEQIWSMFGRRILSGAMKHAGQPMETKRAVPLTPLFDEARQQWIQIFGSVKVTQITGTTEEQASNIINQAIADAVAEGLGEADTARLIQSRMSDAGAQLSRLRSRVIARTEAHNASTAATQAAAEVSGVPMKRRWVSSGGERTRRISEGAAFDHAAVNGQVVGMYEKFAVPGVNGVELLEYPGDPNGSAGNVINCRCVVAYEPD